MKILGIDTSTDFLSIAVNNQDDLLINFDYSCSRRHSSELVSLIAQVLKKVKLTVQDIDGFAVSLGPGSFTGLRIGVATIKGFALSLKKPAVGIPTLDVIAQNAVYFPGIICPVIDARKDKVYSALYQFKNNRLKKTSKYLLTSPDKLIGKIGRKKALFLGDGVKLYKNILKKACLNSEFAHTSLWMPRAAIVAQKGWELLSKGKYGNLNKLNPMYLYSHKCTITGK